MSTIEIMVGVILSGGSLALAVAGWFARGLSASLSELKDAVSGLKTEVAVLAVSQQTCATTLNTTIADHETRLRSLESGCE